MEGRPSGNLSANTLRHLAAGTQLNLIRGAGKDRVVDFSLSLVQDCYVTARYLLYLVPERPEKLGRGVDVVCLFPNRPGSETEQVVRCSGFRSMAKFNRKINRCLSESHEYSEHAQYTRLAVCYGSETFVCKGITGTVYVVWASCVNRTTSTNVASTLYQNVPVLFNLDGNSRIKTMFILKAHVDHPADFQRTPITRDNPKLIFDHTADLFVCESFENPVMSGDSDQTASAAADAAASASMQSMSRKQALASVLRQTKPVPELRRPELNQFAASIDCELEPLEDQFDGGTPREFTANISLSRGLTEINSPTPPHSEDD